MSSKQLAMASVLEKAKEQYQLFMIYVILQQGEMLQMNKTDSKS